jgi:hypothetical protein
MTPRKLGEGVAQAESSCGFRSVRAEEVPSMNVAAARPVGVRISKLKRLVFAENVVRFPFVAASSSGSTGIEFGEKTGPRSPRRPG